MTDLRITQWPQKDPAEQIVATFDARPELRPGEYPISATMTVTVESGVDATPSALLSGLPQIDGGEVLQLIIGGTSGVTYLVHALVSGNAGTKVKISARLPVVSL